MKKGPLLCLWGLPVSAFSLFGFFVCPGCRASPSLCQVLLNTTTDQTCWEHLSQWHNKPTGCLERQSELERVQCGQLQATGNPALINKTSYSQKEEINSSSTSWEDRREEHSITVTQESLHYSELIFAERCPGLLRVQTAKKTEGVGGLLKERVSIRRSCQQPL